MNLPPPTTPKASLHPKNVVSMEGCPLWWAKPNDSFQQVLLPFRPTEISPQWKHLELVNRKLIIFHQDNARSSVSFVSLNTRQNCYNLAGRLRFIYHIHQTLHLWISIYFHLYKILLMENVSIPCKTAKGTCNSSLVKKIFFLMVKTEL